MGYKRVITKFISDDVKQLIKIFFDIKYEAGLTPETVADALSKKDLFIWVSEAFNNTLPGQWSERLSGDAKEEMQLLLDELKFDSDLVPRLTSELLEAEELLAAEKSKEFVKLVTDLSDAIEAHLNERLELETHHFATEYYGSYTMSDQLVQQLKNNQQLRNHLDICLEKMEKEIVNTSSRADIQDIAHKIINQYRSNDWIGELLERMQKKKEQA